MLVRQAAPWLALVSVLGTAGLGVVELMEANRWAATAIWCASVLALVMTWWTERRALDSRPHIDRLFITLAVASVVAASLVV
jgi:hypothetical protein